MIVVVLMMAEMRTMAHVQQSLRTLFTETTLSSHLCNWIIYAMPCITTRMARSQRMPRFRPAGMPIDLILVGWASSHPRNFYHKKPRFLLTWHLPGVRRVNQHCSRLRTVIFVGIQKNLDKAWVQLLGWSCIEHSLEQSCSYWTR